MTLFWRWTVDRSLADAMLSTALRLSLEEQEEGVPHPVPSPSGVAKCLRQNYYRGIRQPIDYVADNGESYISAKSGTLTEDVLAILLTQTPYDRLGMSAPIQSIQRNVSLAHPEYISCAGGEADAVATLEDGHMFLVEFKRKGVFDILSLWRRGLLDAIPDE